MTSTTFHGTVQRPEKLIIGAFAKLVVLGDLADWEAGGPQCVAIDPDTGRRCTSHVPALHEVEGAWAECWIPALEGLLTFFEPAGAGVCFILQLCEPHTKIDAEHAVAPPELVRFDIERHGHLVSRKTAILTPEGQYRAFPESGLMTCTVEPSRRWRERAGAKFREEAARLGPRPTALYRYFDDRERLLYVGITDHIHYREADHVKSSSWMGFAARSTIVRYPTREEALEAESAMIRAERPLFNVVHNDTPEARHRLVEYLVEHGRTDLLAPAVSRG